VVVCFFFLLLGFFPAMASNLPDWLQSVVAAIASLSFLNHFNSIAKGVIDLRDLLYFAMLIGFFLLATSIALDVRKAE